MSANLARLVLKRAAVPFLIGNRFVDPSARLLLTALATLRK